ncbi:hypothetical protein EGK76_08110 [Luteimonas sp. 100069]|nr:hypothetical protein EGK76_08110 [Luteimonas sp. 100069]
MIQQQDEWLVFDGQHLTRSAVRPKLQRAAVVISDFGNAVSNVVSLEGSPAHAVALIEKRLRSDGLIDSESKILIHKTRTMGGGYQTLFTAIALDLWQQTYAWAEGQPDHCLLVPSTSLAWAALKPGQGLVMQSGRSITVLAMLRHDMLYRTSLAFSDDPTDLAMTVGALAEQFAEDVAGGQDTLEPLVMRWCPVLVRKPEDDAPWADDTLREIFAARSGLKINTVPVRRVVDEAGHEYRSGFGWMQSVASPAIAVNPVASRVAYLAERVLPLASAASLVFALVLGALATRWAMSASEADSRADQLHADIAQMQARIDALADQAGVDSDFPATLTFVERAARLQSGADPATSLALVRAASRDEVRILRVRLEPTADVATGFNAGMDSAAMNQMRGGAAAAPASQGYTLRVDGVVDPQRGTPGMQVPTFVDRLRRAGFDPQPLDPQGEGANGRASSGFFSYLIRREHAPLPEAGA